MSRIAGSPRELVIEAPSRWDAVDLTRRLPSCRWFMVERDERHWDVHVPLEPAQPKLAADIAGIAAEWESRRLHGGDPAQPPS